MFISAWIQKLTTTAIKTDKNRTVGSMEAYLNNLFNVRLFKLICQRNSVQLRCKTKAAFKS